MMCKVKSRQARIWGRSFNSARPRLNDPRSCIRVKFLTAKNLISERSIVQAVVCHKREDEQSFKFKAWHIKRGHETVLFAHRPVPSTKVQTKVQCLARTKTCGDLLYQSQATRVISRSVHHESSAQRAWTQTRQGLSIMR